MELHPNSISDGKIETFFLRNINGVLHDLLPCSYYSFTEVLIDFINSIITMPL